MKRTFEPKDLEVVNGRYRVKHSSGGSQSTGASGKVAVERRMITGVVGGKPAASPLYKSQWEARYAQHLEVLKKAGEITHWAYEPLKFKLAAKTYFAPDFFVVTKCGQFQCREVKGFMRDDAAVKLKVAAAMFPWFTFWLVKWEDREWAETRVVG